MVKDAERPEERRYDIARPAARAPASKGYLAGWPMVAIFMAFYFLSFVDRAIISLMVEPIERDLQLTDIEMGLLLGPAFGLLYAIAGFPIGWLLDRYSRRWIATIMVGFWGCATTISGFAHSFHVLFASRLGIGAGEAALSPAAYTMIAEQIPKERLSTAYSIYASGAFLGGGMAIVGGGLVVHALEDAHRITLPFLGQFYPWQVVFLIVGGLTVICAPLALLLKEEVRHAAAAKKPEGAAHKDGFVALLRRDPLFYLGYPFAFGSINVMVTAFIAWTPTFMSRTYGWGTGDISFSYGMTQGCAGVAGLIATGSLVQWLYNRGMADAHVRVPAIGLCITVPALIIGIWSGSPVLFLISSTLFWGLTYTYAGYAPAALQLGTPAQFRARIGALYITFLAVMGTFIGPTTVSWITESVFQDKARIGMSLIIVMLIWTPISLLALAVTGRRLKMRHAEERVLP